MILSVMVLPTKSVRHNLSSIVHFRADVPTGASALLSYFSINYFSKKTFLHSHFYNIRPKPSATALGLGNLKFVICCMVCMIREEVSRYFVVVFCIEIYSPCNSFNHSIIQLNDCMSIYFFIIFSRSYYYDEVKLL